MTTQELAHTEIQRLVTSFKNMPASQRRGMNEMQTRLGYILPMLRALGWDKSNINEFSPNDLDRVGNLEKQIAQVDAEIDQRVHALYRLAEEEIKIVEGK